MIFEFFTTESAEATESEGKGWAPSLWIRTPSHSSVSVLSALSVVKIPRISWLSNRSVL